MADVILAAYRLVLKTIKVDSLLAGAAMPVRVGHLLRMPRPVRTVHG